MHQIFAAMRKKVFPIIATIAVASFATSCGSSSYTPTVTNYRMTQSTSTRVDLAHSVRIIPSIANLKVHPNHVTATAQARELEQLTEEQAKQTVVSKALATVDGDIMLAPRFVIERGDDGNMTSISVTGYAAMISSFRPMKESDVVYNDSLLNLLTYRPSAIALNTMTVADVEYGAKTSTSLSPSELTGKDQIAALELAKKNLLREAKADVLFAEQYTFSLNNNVLTSFTLTAFPGKYVNYRQTTLREQLILKPTEEAVVHYQRTIAADIKPVAQRIQLKFGTGNAGGKESELKEMARSAALQMHNADLLLNETFYFDYMEHVSVINNIATKENIITHVTICGTPAIYTNFHTLKDNEVVDVQFAPIVDNTAQDNAADNTATDSKPSEQKPAGLVNSLLNIFKKK